MRSFITTGASLVAQTVKNLPAVQETQVQSLGEEDPQEKGMVPHFSILAREFHGQRSLVGYSLQDCKESDTTERLTHTHAQAGVHHHRRPCGLPAHTQETAGLEEFLNMKL